MLVDKYVKKHILVGKWRCYHDSLKKVKINICGVSEIITAIKNSFKLILKKTTDKFFIK